LLLAYVGRNVLSQEKKKDRCYNLVTLQTDLSGSPMMKTHFLSMVFSLSLGLAPMGDTIAQTGGGADLFAAVKAGNAEEVRRLLATGADSKVRDNRDAAPLHWAAVSGSKEVAELLIAHGADVNATDRVGYTALHVAAYQSRREVAELLLLNGAQVNARSMSGWIPLEKAMERLADPEITPHQASPSDVAATVSVVELLLDNGAEVNPRKTSGTPMHFAAASGQKTLVELLIAKRADINAKTNEGITPLHMAAKRDRPEVAEMLIARGADVNARTKSNETPLTEVARQGNKEFVDLLIARRADIDAKDQNGRTPLGWALLIATFVSPGSPVGQAMLSRLLSQLSPAEQAQFRNDLRRAKGQWREVAELLLNHGAEASADSKGDSPLYLATLLGDKKLAEALIDRGVDINYAGTGAGAWETALHSAIAEKHQDIAELLINKGADVNARNMSARTPLHFLAVFVDDRKLAELMIKHGADVNARDKNSWTPLSLATKAGNRQVAEALRQANGI
jgi:ankyrin repeat protein